jgi:hypothetical protein
MTWFVIEQGKIVKGWDAWNQGVLIEQLRNAHLKKSSAA